MYIYHSFLVPPLVPCPPSWYPVFLTAIQIGACKLYKTL